MSQSYHGRRESQPQRRGSAPSPRRRRRRRSGPPTLLMLIAAAVLIILVALSLNRAAFSGEEESTSPPPSESQSAEPSPSPSESAPAETEEPSSSLDDLPWNLKLVNASHPLPDDFTVEVTQLSNGHSIDARAYPALQEMMDAARAAGLSPVICSSYRTNETQQRLFQQQVDAYIERGYSEEDAEVEAAVWVAIPGTSEHQLGLAVDIVDLDYQILDEKQEQTPVQQWLMEHCQEYGFILRYPTDKSSITGIGYEPWHYRYVGKEAAEEIMSRGICLEEYLGAVD